LGWLRGDASSCHMSAPTEASDDKKKPASTAEALLAAPANGEADESSPAEPSSTPTALAPAAPAAAEPAAAAAANGAADGPSADAKTEGETSAEKPADTPAATPAVAPVASGPPPPFKIVADSCVMQGRRPKQEDRHVKVPDLTKAARALKMPIDHLEQPCSFFAVYDGHQGHLCADYIAKNFHMKLLKRLSADKEPASWTDERFVVVFREICEELDNEFMTKFRTAIDGCTVVIVLITGTRCVTAWVGDSRCLLGRRTSKGHLMAVALTEDHTPKIKTEAQRVIDAGGIVVDLGFTARVAHEGYEERLREIRRAQAQGLGTIGKEPVALAVSRALGDRDFKAVTGKALLVPTPDVRCIRLDKSHLFIALMCDGILDVMSNDDVIEDLGTTVADKTLVDATDPVANVRSACGALVQEAYKRNSQDNLTVIMVRFEWTGADASDHITKRKQVEAAVDESAVGKAKRRRVQAQSNIKDQKVKQQDRLYGDDVEMTPAPITPPKMVPVAKPKAAPTWRDDAEAAAAAEAGYPEPAAESAEAAEAESEAVATPAPEAAVAASASTSPAPAQPEPNGDAVVVTGHSRADMNGCRGVVIKTISDGRKVVKLADGRELAFKAENLQPAGSAPAVSSSSAAKAPSAAAAPAAKAANAAPGGEEVILHGLPRADQNGLRGVVVKTITDGRKVIRLSDGRELAFKPENMRPPGPEDKATNGGNNAKDDKKPEPAKAASAAAKAPAAKADPPAKKEPPKDEAKKAKPAFTFV